MKLKYDLKNTYITYIHINCIGKDIKQKVIVDLF